MQVGQRVEVHRYACLSPDMHRRSVVGGIVISQRGDGWVVYLDEPVDEYGGQWVEGPYWFAEGACPNAVAVGERAA